MDFTCVREFDFDRSNASIFSSTGRWLIICVRWGMGRPLSGDICGGNGGDMDRRRSFSDGTWGSGDGIGVVDVEECPLAKSNCKFGFVGPMGFWLFGVEIFDNGTFGTLS